MVEGSEDGTIEAVKKIEGGREQPEVSAGELAEQEKQISEQLAVLGEEVAASKAVDLVVVRKIKGKIVENWGNPPSHEDLMKGVYEDTRSSDELDEKDRIGEAREAEFVKLDAQEEQEEGADSNQDVADVMAQDSDRGSNVQEAHRKDSVKGLREDEGHVAVAQREENRAPAGSEDPPVRITGRNKGVDATPEPSASIENIETGADVVIDSVLGSGTSGAKEGIVVEGGGAGADVASEVLGAGVVEVAAASGTAEIVAEAVSAGADLAAKIESMNEISNPSGEPVDSGVESSVPTGGEAASDIAEAVTSGTEVSVGNGEFSNDDILDDEGDDIEGGETSNDDILDDIDEGTDPSPSEEINDDILDGEEGGLSQDSLDDEDYETMDDIEGGDDTIDDIDEDEPSTGSGDVAVASTSTNSSGNDILDQWNALEVNTSPDNEQEALDRIEALERNSEKPVAKPEAESFSLDEQDLADDWEALTSDEEPEVPSYLQSPDGTSGGDIPLALGLDEVAPGVIERGGERSLFNPDDEDSKFELKMMELTDRKEARGIDADRLQNFRERMRGLSKEDRDAALEKESNDENIRELGDITGPKRLEALGVMAVAMMIESGMSEDDAESWMESRRDLYEQDPRGAIKQLEASIHYDKLKKLNESGEETAVKAVGRIPAVATVGLAGSGFVLKSGVKGARVGLSAAYNSVKIGLNSTRMAAKSMWNFLKEGALELVGQQDKSITAVSKGNEEIDKNWGNVQEDIADIGADLLGGATDIGADLLGSVSGEGKEAKEIRDDGKGAKESRDDARNARWGKKPKKKPVKKVDKKPAKKKKAA